MRSWRKHFLFFIGNRMNFHLKLVFLCGFCLLSSEVLAQTASISGQSGSVSGNYLSGQFSRSRGNMDEAIAHLREVRRQFPDDMNVAVQLQGLLLLQGEINESLVIAEAIERSQTKDPLADLVLVLSAIKTNDFDKATSILEDSKESGSVQLWVPLVQGWVDLANGQLVAPLTMESLGMDVGRISPLMNYHLGLINDQAGFKEAAAQNYHSAVEDPQHPSNRIMAIVLQFYDQQASPEILSSLVQDYKNTHPEVVMKAPVIKTPLDGVAEVLYTMGGVMYGAGVVGDAAIYLQLALYVKPDMEESVIALADALSELRQYKRSNATYAKIKPASAAYPKVQLRIAVNYERMGQLAQSIHYLDALAKTSPSPDIFITKGDLYRFHSQLREAVAAYGEALKLIPKDSPSRWSVLFARAACLDRLGQWSEAEKDLKAALVVNPDQPDVLNYLGFAYLERSDQLDEASAMISKAIKARPNDAQIMDSMGWVLYLQSNYAEAATYLEKATELLPSDPAVNDHLGDVYWRLGRKNEAQFQWERSLSFSPEAKLMESLQKKLKYGLPDVHATVAH
jgi:tetratricopeptide (TPR) repeat protein